jgi:ABC-type sugar transport system substrate-binding protein
MPRKFIALTGGLVFALTLGGCAANDPGASSSDSASGENLTIGLVMLQGDQYFSGIQAGLEAAVSADGGTVITANSNNDAGTEAAAVQNMIQRQVDAIIMQPVSDTGSLATMKLVVEANIPLICYGNCTGEALNPEIVSGVSQSDNTALGTATGAVAAEYIAASLGGEAVVGILNCDSAAETCKLRKSGFKQALVDAGVSVTYASDQEGYLADKATSVAIDMLSANPAINLLWSANEGGTVGLVIGSQQSGRSVPVFGTDISAQLAGFALDADDVLQATTGQDPKATAASAYAQAKNAIAGVANSPFENQIVGITYTRADPTAINQFLEENK